MKRLNGKIAIITGGAGGLGLAYAKRFIEEDAKVVLADVNEAAGQQAAADLGSSAAFFKLDVTSGSNWQEIFDFTAKQFGKVSVLVNNAGIANAPVYIEDFPLEDWDRVININLTGTMLGMKTAIKSMGKDGGAIVNVASAIGDTGFPLAAAYSASKAAVTEITRTAALEVAQKGYPIAVNSVHPGWVDTGIIPEDMKKMVLKNIPKKKMGKPEDIANLVLYLASDEASYATGGMFVVDGGFLAQ